VYIFKQAFVHPHESQWCLMLLRDPADIHYMEKKNSISFLKISSFASHWKK